MQQGHMLLRVGDNPSAVKPHPRLEAYAFADENVGAAVIVRLINAQGVVLTVGQARQFANDLLDKAFEAEQHVASATGQPDPGEPADAG